MVCDQNAKVYVREPIQGGVSYWTGPGYMKVMEGDSIEISIANVPFSTFYDFVIRYDPRVSQSEGMFSFTECGSSGVMLFTLTGDRKHAVLT